MDSKKRYIVAICRSIACIIIIIVTQRLYKSLLRFTASFIEVYRVQVVTLLIIRHICISVGNLLNLYLFRQDATIIIFKPAEFLEDIRYIP